MLWWFIIMEVYWAPWWRLGEGQDSIYMMHGLYAPMLLSSRELKAILHVLASCSGFNSITPTPHWQHFPCGSVVTSARWLVPCSHHTAAMANLCCFNINCATKKQKLWILSYCTENLHLYPSMMTNFTSPQVQKAFPDLERTDEISLVQFSSMRM